MIKSRIIKFLYKCIEKIEKIQYRNIDLDENDINKKILKSFEVNKLKVKSDKGWVKVSSIHETQPYKIYDIILSNGYKLECADNHILFDDKLTEIFAKDLKKGQKLYTDTGFVKIVDIKISNIKLSMGDLTVDSDDHRYFTNGILSHNTVSSSLFILHYLIFNNDKNAMLIANKGDTVIEVVDKIKSIYTLLPFFIKPGVKIWNQKSLTFENGCRIKTSARTKTPAIGFTIDLLYMDEFAHIPSNILEPFYTAAYPTVSAIKNSKIIITSTPNGMNLFHKLLTNAERPLGDPLRNSFKPMRVYWYQVPGRFVTYIRLNNHLMYEYGVDKDTIYNMVNDAWGDKTKVFIEYNLDLDKDIINVYNNDICSEDDIMSMTFKDNKGRIVSLLAISEITTWKKEAIKDIGSEAGFNQEYDLRFINSSKSLLTEGIIDDLLKGKKNYVWQEIDILEDKLKFPYNELTWVDDEDLFKPILRKSEKIILSVDLSEGLGQDYSIINIFRISPKDKDFVDKNKEKYKLLSDYFCLEQIGIYRSNIISIKQMAELLYLLCFEYFNPDNVKVVLELNTYGSTLLAELPHVFDGFNNYGSYIFFRYKHQLEAEEEKIGLKINNNKNLLVKDYQDLMKNRSFIINNEDNIREITTFVRHTTSAGNTKYAADGNSNDDTVMTIINTGTIFPKFEFREMVEDWAEEFCDPEYLRYAKDSLDRIGNIDVVDYSQVLNIRKKNMNRFGRGNDNPWLS